MTKRSHKRKRRICRIAHAISEASLLSTDGTAITELPDDCLTTPQRVLVKGRPGEIKLLRFPPLEWRRISDVPGYFLRVLARCDWRPSVPASPLELLARAR